MYGIDVSHHQGDVDFYAAALDSDMRFAIVKATEGKDYEDPRFEENWNKLLELDPYQGTSDVTMVRGVYHFARPDLRPDWGRSAGELEASWMCQVLKRVGGYLEGSFAPALDWEKYPGSTSVLNNQWIEGFIHVTEQEIGRKPMIYTGPNVWYYTTGDTDQFNDLSLWEVKYSNSGSDPAANPPVMPRTSGTKPWPWTFWQWSGGGSYRYYKEQFGPVAGIPSGSCDVNRYDGTMEELYDLAMMNATPVPPPAQPGAIMPVIDLATAGTSSFVQITAIVQGLLMANGYGPSGLVGSDGLPDGKAGPATLDALKDFKNEHGIPESTVVDPTTWWLLLVP